MIEKGIESDDLANRLLELGQEKKDIEKQISVEEIKKPVLEKDKIVFWINKLLTSGCVDDIEYQQKIIDTLVNKVFIYDNPDGGQKIVITYNTSSHVTSSVDIKDIQPFVYPNTCSDIKDMGSPIFRIC